MSTMEEINIWPPLIYRTKYEGDLTRLQDLFLQICKKQPHHIFLRNGGKSTYNIQNILMWDDFTELRTWIEEKAQIAWKEMKFDTEKTLKIHYSWCNYHPPGAWCTEHNHGISQLVAVMYIKHPDKSGNLLFKNPLQYHFSSWPQRSDYNEWTSLPVNTGDLIFFPGFILHKSEVNESQEDRLMLATNMNVDTFENISVE